MTDNGHVKALADVLVDVVARELLAQQLRAVAGDVRELAHSVASPEYETELRRIEQALEGVAARAETENPP